MRWICLVLLFISGCALPASEAGYIDGNNTNIEPYIYSFSGSSVEFNRTIKRFLIQNGFSIASEDSSAGIIITYPRPLEKDETINSGAVAFANFLVGDKVDEEMGVVSIIYDYIQHNQIIMKMQCSKTMKGSTDTGIGRRNVTDNRKLTQGEPLSMKMKILLLKDSRFVLGSEAN